MQSESMKQIASEDDTSELQAPLTQSAIVESPEAVMLEMKGAEDMFGWVEIDDNSWYNSVIGALNSI